MRNKKILRYAIIGVASACVAIATFDNGDSKVITYPKSVTVHAAVKQTVTDNYARDDIQSIFSAIQNSSDPVKTDRVLTDEYNKLSKKFDNTLRCTYYISTRLQCGLWPCTCDDYCRCSS